LSGDFFNDFESIFGDQEKKRDYTKEVQQTQANLEAKKLIHIRLDRDILAFFQADGEGYQTRINAALRTFMTQQKKKNASRK
jgi:uncharacterized protein (DUF4415 family)